MRLFVSLNWMFDQVWVSSEDDEVKVTPRGSHAEASSYMNENGDVI